MDDYKSRIDVYIQNKIKNKKGEKNNDNEIK